MESLLKVLSGLLLNRKRNIILSTLEISRMPFYAVAKGKSPGIFLSWPDCEAQVRGFSGAKYKKFNTITEAESYITTNGGSNITQNANVRAKNLKTNKNFASNNLKRPYSSSSSISNSVLDQAKGISKGNKDNNSIDLNYTLNKQVDSLETNVKSDEYSGSWDDRGNNETLSPNKSRGYTDNVELDSDDSDDLNDILTKQMDDIEKRIKGVEKNVNKIIKKNVKDTVQRKSILIEPPKPKQKRNIKTGFEYDNDGYVQVYTDGACSSNGKNGARAGLGVFWGEDHPLNISEPVSGRATNNCGEIQAATRAIQVALQNGITHLNVNTDSKFLINSITKWVPGWKRKGWKLKSGEPVKNVIDFKELDSIQNNLNVKWNYVEAHRGVYGNEMADRLAKDGAALYNN